MQNNESKRRITRSLLAGTTIVFLACLTVHSTMEPALAATVLYVSPGGNDAWSGITATPAQDGSDGPLATLHKAVELSRQQAVGESRRIVLQVASITSTSQSTWDRKTLA